MTENRTAADTIERRLKEFKRRALDPHDVLTMRERVERRMHNGLALDQAWEEAERAYWNWWAE